MRFLIDTQLPPLLAGHLVSLGHQAEHTVDIGMASSDDRHIWQYAVANAAIVVTKDEDFVTIRALGKAVGAAATLWVGE